MVAKAALLAFVEAGRGEGFGAQAARIESADRAASAMVLFFKEDSMGRFEDASTAQLAQNK